VAMPGAHVLREDMLNGHRRPWRDDLRARRHGPLPMPAIPTTGRPWRKPSILFLGPARQGGMVGRHARWPWSGAAVPIRSKCATGDGRIVAPSSEPVAKGRWPIVTDEERDHG